jgi:hypothetical protein
LVTISDTESTRGDHLDRALRTQCRDWPLEVERHPGGAFEADRPGERQGFRLIDSRNSKAKSGTSQLIHVARGSTHGSATSMTVANPPNSLSTTAEHNRTKQRDIQRR